VISLFEINRDPDEFFESYQSLIDEYSLITDKFGLARQFVLSFNDFEFLTYIIKGYGEKPLYSLQTFINCGDKVACFMITLDYYSENVKYMIANDETFSALAKILRTIQ
jgi:hypothetical protein